MDNIIYNIKPDPEKYKNKQQLMRCNLWINCDNVCEGQGGFEQILENTQNLRVQQEYVGRHIGQKLDSKGSTWMSLKVVRGDKKVKH